jgi:hypothetical protein
MLPLVGPHSQCAGDDVRHLVEPNRSEVFRGKVAARAEKLLRAWLSPDQLDCYPRFGYFDVIGSASGRRYRICRGMSFNIHELDDDGDSTCKWCVVPVGPLAPGDLMLAQKIALETSERKVLRIANREPPRLRDLARVLARMSLHCPCGCGRMSFFARPLGPRSC